MKAKSNKPLDARRGSDVHKIYVVCAAPAAILSSYGILLIFRFIGKRVVNVFVEFKAHFFNEKIGSLDIRF